MKSIRAVPALVLLALLLSLLPGAPSAAAADAPFWSRVVGLPTNFEATGIDTPAPGLAWVSGRSSVLVNGQYRTEGALMRLVALDGIWTWDAVYAAPQPLLGVKGISPDEAWAVGEQGTVLHLVNRTPIFEQVVPTNASLQSVAVENGVVWAAGYISARGAGESVVARRTNSGWEQVTGLPFNNLALRKIVVRNGDVWVAGGKLLRLSAGSWADLTPPFCSGEPNCVVNVTDLAFRSDGTLILVGTLFVTSPESFITEAVGTEWRTVWRSDSVAGASGSQLTGVTIGADGTAFAVGTSNRQNSKFSRGGLVLQRTSAGWSEIGLPQPVAGLRAAAITGSGQALALDVGRSIYTYGYPLQAGLALDVTLPVDNPNQQGVLYFPETGHTLRGEFRNRWEQFGGLAQFGYPRTEEVREVNQQDGKTYVVQYFERARFELHPENAAPYNVLLGLLGRDKIAGRENEDPFRPRAGSGPGYAPETGHTIAPEFYGYWQARGGLAIFGYPLSEAFQEVNPADGRTYVVQYFERNRFEFHPELPEPYRVSLGLLGNETLVRAGVL